MKKAKLVKNNKKQEIIEKDSYSLKSFLLIILVLVIILGIFYFITTLVVKPVNTIDNNNRVTIIDETKITLNNLLNRKEKEYYVLATKQNNNAQANYQTLYNNYINEYKKQENALTFYNVNLDDALNKGYISNKLNISNDLSKLKVNDDILFKIKDNKIEEYFAGSKNILKELSTLKESK